MIRITSSKNDRLKHIKSLQQKKWRTTYNEYICEGEKSVLEAYWSGAIIKSLVISDDYTVPHDLLGINDIIMVPKGIFEAIADTKTPQGILAIIEQNKVQTQIPSEGLLVYCDGVRDPGNLGTIIRTADAAGFTGVLLSNDCADVFSPKVIRSTMGSFFHIGIYTDVDYKTLKDLLSTDARTLYGGILSDKTLDYRSVKYTAKSIIAVGNEANGMRDEVIELCTPIKIPIYGKAESLNASVAASIMMYEAQNQINL